MRLRPIVVLVAVAALLTACGDDSDDKAAPAPAPAGSTAAADPPGAPDTRPGGAGKPEIATNPDGTINSGGPRPGTSETVLTAGGFGPYKIGVAQKTLESGGLV